MYYFTKSRKFSIIATLICLINVDFFSFAQEKIGSFTYDVFVAPNGINSPYVETESLGTDQKGKLSWGCIVNGSTGKILGAAITLLTEELVETELAPEPRSESVIIPVSYTFDDTTSGLTDFFVITENVLSFTIRPTNSFSSPILSASKVRLKFWTSEKTSFTYVFDLSGLREAIERLPCASEALGQVEEEPQVDEDTEREMQVNAILGVWKDTSSINTLHLEFYADGTGITSKGDTFDWEIFEKEKGLDMFDTPFGARAFVRAKIGDRRFLYIVTQTNRMDIYVELEDEHFYGGNIAPYVRMTEEERAAFEAFASAPVITDQGTGETVDESICVPSDPLNVQGSFESRSKEYERWTTCTQKESISPLVAAAVEGYFGLASRLTNQLENNKGLFALSDADTFLNELSNTIYQANSQSYSNVLEQNALVSPLTGEILDSPLQWAIDQARFEQGVAEDFIKNNGTSQIGFLNITVTLYLPIVSDAVGASLDMIAGLPPYIYEAFPEYRWALQQMGSLSYEDRNTREAIGIAAIFINFGLSQEQYEKYITDGVLPEIP
jgi:hypothetical protein